MTPKKPTELKVDDYQVIAKYVCKRCGAACDMWVDPDQIQKTIPCKYCGSGRMRLKGLPPAAEFRTKSQRFK